MDFLLQKRRLLALHNPLMCYIFAMLSKEMVKNWLRSQRMTRKELAEACHVNYKALCSVLAGPRPISARLASNIKAVMRERQEGLRVHIPADIEPVLRTWAAARGVSVDKLVVELLSNVLKVQLRK